MRLAAGTMAAALAVSAAVAQTHAGGKAAKTTRSVSCLIDEPPRQRCLFTPQNGDGSFALDTAGGLIYTFSRIGPDTMDIEYFNGARPISQGTFIRSKDDRACWVKRPDRRICAW